MDLSETPLVVDLGEHSTKVGQAGEECPLFIDYSARAIPLTDSDLSSAFGANSVFPLHPAEKLDSALLEHPFEYDPSTAATTIRADAVRHILSTLTSPWNRGDKLPLAGCNLLICEPTTPSKNYRSKMAQILFEDLGAASVAMCKKAALTAFACGRTSAAVLDSGYSCTVAALVSEGFVSGVSVCPSGGKSIDSLVESSIAKQSHADQGGLSSGGLLPAYQYYYPRTRDKPSPLLTPIRSSTATKPSDAATAELHTSKGKSQLDPDSFLERLLTGAEKLKILCPAVPADAKVKIAKCPYVHPTYSVWASNRFIESIKESYCNCATRPYRNPSSAGRISESFTLPDNTVISIGDIKFGVAESLFDATRNADGLPRATAVSTSETVTDSLLQSIFSSEIGTSRDILRGILLTGGTSSLPGYIERLRHELSTREDFMSACGTIPIKVIASNKNWERSLASWIGGSILASLGSYTSFASTITEYNEYGVAVLNRKCP